MPRARCRRTSPRSEWFADVARVLRPAGVLAMNAADEPDHRHAARVLAGLAAHLPHTAAIAQVDIWKRRRFGNLVLVGSRQPLLMGSLIRSVARGAFPSTVLEGRGPRAGPGVGTAVHRRRRGAVAPAAHATGGWRIR